MPETLSVGVTQPSPIHPAIRSPLAPPHPTPDSEPDTTPPAVAHSGRLSAGDLQRCVGVLAALPAKPDGFAHWFAHDLRQLLPYTAAFAGFGNVAAGHIQLKHWHSHGFSPEYLAQLAQSFDVEVRTSLAWWLKERDAFCIDPEQPPPFTSGYELTEINAWQFERVSAHGVLNLSAAEGSYFSFTGMKSLPTAWIQAVLRLMIGPMHAAYTAHAAQALASGAGHTGLRARLQELTPAQRTVVALVCQGKSDKAVAAEAGCSAKTVRNHLSQVYATLNLSGRAALVAALR
jgi:DNA-binding CsgD family transcriptional regulator